MDYLGWTLAHQRRAKVYSAGGRIWGIVVQCGRYIYEMKNGLAWIFVALALAGCSTGVSTVERTVTETVQPADDSRLDESFLGQVALIDGFDGETKRTLIDLGHSVCNAFESGHKIDVLRILNDRYGIESAAKFMHASATSYCPDQLTNS